MSAYLPVLSLTRVSNPCMSKEAANFSLSLQSTKDWIYSKLAQTFAILARCCARFSLELLIYFNVHFILITFSLVSLSIYARKRHANNLFSKKELKFLFRINIILLSLNSSCKRIERFSE